VTYYELVGGKGLIDEDASPLPLHHIFAEIAELPAAEVLPVESPAPLAIQALALRSGGMIRVLVANLSPQPQSVLIVTRAKSARVRWLGQEEQTLPAESGLLKLELSPYAVARADVKAGEHG
jgi:hypothetical protein